MFGIGRGKLLREGAETQGRVVDTKLILLEGNSLSDEYYAIVRVQFEDGSSAEIKRKLSTYEVGRHSPGAILPLLYDPANHSKIEIDVPALKASQDADRAELDRRKAEAIALAEQQISGGIGPRPAAAQGASAADPAASTTDFSELTAAMEHVGAVGADFSATVTAIKHARAIGDLAEVERLKAELAHRRAQ